MRCVVVHSGKRDGYNVVKAFGKEGLLITDFYPTGIFRYIPKINSRYEASVSARWSIIATLYLVLLRLTKNQRYSVLRDRAVSRYAATVIKSDDFIIAYQGFANSLMNFKYILFLFHPYFKEIRRIYSKYTDETVGFLSELEVQMGREIEYYSDEILNATSVIVASRFSENSLLRWHKNLNIHHIPYGVKSVGKLRRSHASRNKISVLFWSQYVERKGVQFLKDLNSDRFDLNVLWRDRFDSVHRVDWAVYYNDLPWDDVENLLSSIDVLLMPSIAEGYGQVALEALSYGIPVIGSNNSVLQELDKGVVAIDPEDVVPYLNEISMEGLDILKNEALMYSPLSWTCFRKEISALLNT